MDSKSKEAESGFLKNRIGNPEHSRHENRRSGIRQDVASDDMPGILPKDSGTLHVFGLSQCEELAADKAGCAGPAYQANYNDDIE